MSKYEPLIFAKWWVFSEVVGQLARQLAYYHPKWWLRSTAKFNSKVSIKIQLPVFWLIDFPLMPIFENAKNRPLIASNFNRKDGKIRGNKS